MPQVIGPRSMLDAVANRLGLPFFRVSVDHGTAFDLAWQGKASDRSMTEAILLAAELARPTPLR